MSDTLHRFQLENLSIRGEWVSLESSWREIQKTAQYPKAVRQVLGEALVATALLAESLKFDGSLILQIRGASPLTLLVVQASDDGAIRGIAHWKGDIADDIDFNDLMGEGTMVISVESNKTSQRYQSLVSLKGDSLADCFSAYFAQSEQLNTQLWLAVDEQRAAGVLLQSLPAKDDFEQASENWRHASILADTLNNERGKQELLNLDVENLLTRLFHQETLRFYKACPIRFACTCSREKVENTIRSLGEVEANSIIEEQGSISVDCEFCHTHYELDRVDVARLFHADQSGITGIDNGKRLH